jgi:hypothetical protein
MSEWNKFEEYVNNETQPNNFTIKINIKKITYDESKSFPLIVNNNIYIDGVPTILLAHDDKIITYHGCRTMNAFINFVEQNIDNIMVKAAR